MIEGIQGKGVNKANVVCDECSMLQSFVCGYHKVNPHQSEPDIGQLNSKAAASGWSVVRKKHYCPGCAEARKVTNVVKIDPKKDTPKRPSLEQKRQINAMVGECYDTKEGRYMRGDTDQTIADVLGVMPGWVAEIREDFYGPDGGNVEMDALAEELDEFMRAVNKRLHEAKAEADAMAEHLEKAKLFAGQLAKIRKAVGGHTLRKAGVS